MNQPNEELARIRYNAPRLQAQVTWSAKQIAAKDAEIARLKAALDRTCCAEHRETRKRLERLKDLANRATAHDWGTCAISEVYHWKRMKDMNALRAALAEGKGTEVVVKVPAEKEHVDE